MRKAEGVTNVVTYYKTLLPTLVSKDRHTTVVFASMKGNEGTTQEYIKGVRKAVKGTTLEHYVTGEAAVNRDFSITSDHDLRRAEVITFTLVLILLLFTFRTLVAASLPLLLGGAAVASGTALIYLIGTRDGHVGLRPQRRVDDRPRPRDRLLADRGQPFPGGARQTRRHRGGGRGHDGDRRPLDPLLGRHGDARHDRALGCSST